ncbi:MAG: hypothetical protein RL514_494 [Verrucomicrobiota bacterium]|jgi:hypothetical protein
MDTNAFNARLALTYGAVIPLALVFGYLLATPMSALSFAGVGLVLFVIALPFLLRWHHALLIGCWNAVFICFFLPGKPPVWAALAAVSLGIAVVSRTLRHQSKFLSVRSVTLPLVLLGIIVVVTIAFRGIGGRAFGSELWGAKRYLGVLGAILGYFALTSQTIPRRQGVWLAGAFFLSGTTAALCDLAFTVGPSFYFLFLFVPTELAVAQASTQDTLMRLTGVAWMAQAGNWFMLMRYGIRGLLEVRHAWRGVVFVGLFLLGLFGGFRSSIILMGVLFATQFWFEGLLRTKWFPITVLAALLVGAVLVGYAEKLPLSVQRSLSFLPIDVHPTARQDALGTLEWRLQMWRVVWTEVPHYLWVGKGYTFSSTDFLLTQEAIRRGMFTLYEDTLVSGNYHNGILSLLVPFGLAGTLAFVAFCWAGWGVLRRNYLYGPPEFTRINTFLIAFFTARLLFYLVFYGQFDLDLMVFTGLVGMSIALNGGVCVAARRPQAESPHAPPPHL